MENQLLKLKQQHHYSYSSIIYPFLNSYSINSLVLRPSRAWGRGECVRRLPVPTYICGKSILLMVHGTIKGVSSRRRPSLLRVDTLLVQCIINFNIVLLVAMVNTISNVLHIVIAPSSSSVRLILYVNNQ